MLAHTIVASLDILAKRNDICDCAKLFGETPNKSVFEINWRSLYMSPQTVSHSVTGILFMSLSASRHFSNDDSGLDSYTS